MALSQFLPRFLGQMGAVAIDSQNIAVRCHNFGKTVRLSGVPSMSCDLQGVDNAHSVRAEMKKALASLQGLFKFLAPQPGLEPGTYGLTEKTNLITY